jgi:hypothetical protein
MVRISYCSIIHSERLSDIPLHLGTAIYAYFIIPNTVQFATTLTNTTFELDGEFVGRFEHVPTSAETFEFNVPGYVNTTLPPGQHQFNIIGTGDTNASVILFDYAVYTYVDMHFACRLVLTYE